MAETLFNKIVYTIAILSNFTVRYLWAHIFCFGKLKKPKIVYHEYFWSFLTFMQTFEFLSTLPWLSMMHSRAWTHLSWATLSLKTELFIWLKSGKCTVSSTCLIKGQLIAMTPPMWGPYRLSLLQSTKITWRMKIIIQETYLHVQPHSVTQGLKLTFLLRSRQMVANVKNLVATS